MTTIGLWSVNQWKEKIKDGDEQAVSTALRNVYHAALVSQRFDAFCGLIAACDDFIAVNGQHAPASRLRQQALSFAMTLVDARDEENFLEKVAKRKKYRLIDETYMPWVTPASCLSAEKAAADNREEFLRKRARQEVKNKKQRRYAYVHVEQRKFDHRHGVLQLSATERECYRIFPHQGKLKNIQLKKPLTCESCSSLNCPHVDDHYLIMRSFNTMPYCAHARRGRAIFVISPLGDMFAASTIDGFFHHSTFLASNAVLFAGTIKTVKGRVKRIDDHSGHYTGTPWQSVQGLAFLRKAELLHEQLRYRMFDDQTGYFEKQTIRSLHRYDTFQLSQPVRDRVVAAVNKYINARTVANNEERLLSWTSRYFRNPRLTQAKLDNAKLFLTTIDNTDDYAELLRAVRKFKFKDSRIETNFGKSYFFITSSGFKRTMQQIERIVDEERMQWVASNASLHVTFHR